ncbi:MAG TPA: dihydroorotate dehydrogenase-like protein [Anaeromyxobacteraceae bacterium]
MADLTTSYLGLSLPSPLVLASSSLSNRVENFQLAEQSGAGAVVLRSLFEEQIEAADTALQESLSYGADITAEATRSFFPHQRIGPAEYLQLIARAKRAVRIPVIGSVNCVAPGSWSDYAKQVAEAGADALEVNLYAVQADAEVSAAEVEARYLDVVSSIVQRIQIPVAVKLSPHFTALANFVRKLDGVGARGYVLFNRFLQPDISVERMSLQNAMPLSEPQEMLLSLRWVALLYGRTPADLAASTGVHDASGVVKQILAGASVVQLAAALIKNGIPYLEKLREGLDEWMDKHGFSQLSDCRGTLSQRVIREPGAFERAQYVHLILSQN